MADYDWGAGPDAAANLPQPLPEPPPVPEPEDKPYCGTIRLEVDVTDVQRRIYRVKETIPVPGPGPMLLIYPKWLPGFHAPQAPIELFAGLEIMRAASSCVEAPPGDGERLPHRRAGRGEEVEASFQFLSPDRSLAGRVIATPDC
jgi:hypothetical protein